MAQYVVVVVTLVEADNEDAAERVAATSICQDGGGAWMYKEIITGKEPEQ